jgi:hypothetical protein
MKSSEVCLFLFQLARNHQPRIEVITFRHGFESTLFPKNKTGMPFSACREGDYKSVF